MNEMMYLRFSIRTTVRVEEFAFPKMEVYRCVFCMQLVTEKVLREHLTEYHHLEVTP